ncbi:NAD(P)H-binding protein [Actinoplanes sp. CA-030573]|uniref:NAD(P)H-binding protein n=1 Tax=Actinoplanes sp. CA-030573 TaxID=3239898 RepID=UPI003D90E308
MRIIVLGATGNVGGEVTAQAAALGHDVRAVARHRPADLPAGATFVRGDLNDASSYADALTGADALFTLPGYGGLADTLASVPKVVLLSSSAAPSGRKDNAVAKYMIDSEETVRGSGVAWTFLRPNAFMSNALRWLPQLREGDVIREAFGDVPLSVVHPADLAAVAVAALTEDRHDGQAYRLSGPETLSTGERVRMLGDAIGRPLTFEALPDDVARAEMLKDTPQPYVDAFFQFYREGLIDETTVQPTFEQVMGRPPRTFADWLAGNADRFR